jgi:glycosyltransferase involved in cell wall biosynthesis
VSAKPRDVIIDIARLATRFSRPVPNGIDRVDLGYAQYFLSSERGGQGAVLGPTGPRAVANPAARQIVAAIATHWRETGRAEDDQAYQQLGRFLDGGSRHVASGPSQQNKDQSSRRISGALVKLLRDGAVLGRGAMFPGQSLAKTVPQDAVYLNISQFPLWIDGYFRWLDRRPDVRAVFFIHDLLPIEYPEFFPAAEAHRHARRLEVLARRAAGIIVASHHTRRALEAYFVARGRSAPPICVCPLPVTANISGGDEPAPLRRHPYFVSVGTLEPRKNQLFLLNIWRDLVDTLGADTPRLVLVGARGWDNENVVDMIERCARIKPYVIETGCLSTPALRQVMRGARAVLMPTFAEGFGLPVAEAQAAGVHVIASDIPSFRDLQGTLITLLDPLDGPSWLSSIQDRVNGTKPDFNRKLNTDRQTVMSWLCHMRHIDDFIANVDRYL